MQPFRSDIDALEARHAVLTTEVAERTRARDEAAQMLAEARLRERNSEIAADYAAGGPARRKRRAITIVLGTFALGIAIAGFVRLKANERDSREQRTQRVFAQFEAFADDACKCSDSACVTQLSDRMSKWGAEVAKQMPQEDNVKPDEKWMKRAQVLGERMGKCMTDAMTPAEPSQRVRPGDRETVERAE